MTYALEKTKQAQIALLILGLLVGEHGLVL
jgi:hypothetical protein